jgi:ABC-type Fe3+/spermidine/putrescine transport system ATPase subunit
MDNAIIQLNNITKKFDGEIVLDDITLSVKENEFVTFLGPSGCGKTTTLRIIGGFEKPDEGQVYFDGQLINDIPPFKRQLNTVFQKYALFPHLNVHKVCKREIVNKYAPVYKWEGKNNNYKPVLFLGHYDVVPADKSSETLWKEDPFSGIIKDGCIWGRGTLDDKNQVIAIMEAAEHLISNGFIPERDIYFAFGFDEEVGGQKGAKKISELFQERKLQFDFVIDEGGCVIKDVIEAPKYFRI